MSCIVQKYQTYGECDDIQSVCDVIQSVCDVVNKVRVMTQISGCDVTCIVYMWPYILDVIPYIQSVISQVQ